MRELEGRGPQGNPPTEILLPKEQVLVSNGGTSGYVYMEPADASGGRSQDGDLFEYLQLVGYHKYTVITALLVGALLGWSITFVQTPLYDAKTDIEIKSMAESDSVYRIVDKDWQGGTGSAAVTPESYLETQLHILKSRSFQERVLDKVKTLPRTNTSTVYGLRQLVLSKIGVKDLASSNSGLPPIKCDSKIVENTRIVQLDCQSPDPGFAANYANTTAQEFIAYNLEVQTSTAEHTLQWLTNQLADMRSKVEQARASLDHYSAASGVKFEANEPDTEKSALGDLQKELAAAHVQRINDEAAYEIALSTSRSDQPFDEHWATSQEQVLKLKSQLQQLSQKYTSDHPQIAQLKAEIDTLQKIMSMQASAYVAILKDKYDASQLREKRLLQALAHQSDVVLGAARKSTEYENLRRELDRNQKLYEDLLQKATEVSLSTAMRGSSQIRVVDSAETPSKPFRPVVAKAVGLGCVTGLMLGLGLVFIGERTNRKLRRPGEASFHLSLPELAVVPSYGGVAGLVDQVGGDGKPAPLMHRIIRLAGSRAEGSGMTLEKPGQVAEAFRGAVTSLLAYRNWRQASRKILVTSTAQGDGKSTVISNLGITFAELGYSVVLVDGDIRRPHLNEIFGLTNSWGLTTLVTGESNIKTAPLEGLVQKTKIDNLSVLTAGPGTSSISRVLHSKATRELFERLASEFDFLLADSPPVTEFSDARLLGRLVDGAILVFRCGVTTREAAMLVRDRLFGDNLVVIGTILNRWDGKSQGPTYYGYRYRGEPV